MTVASFDNWQRTTGGYCENRSCGKRARWRGPITESGGDLWCGGCKREQQKAERKSA